MSQGITLKVLGDYGPFSRMGKSIGYQVTIGDASYLVDCGSPIFQQIGGHGLKAIRGMIITHCHDDHKRWFSDHALFNMYAPDVSNRVFIMTSESINEDLITSSGPALFSSLSVDSKRVVDVSYDEYIDFRLLGPRAKYRVVNRVVGNGQSHLQVVDSKGDAVGPEKAKVIISRKNGRSRLLFKDPDYGEWVEPESFYPFSSAVFYEADRNIYRDPEGFTIEAINAPVWHGVPGIGVKFTTPGETLVFSGDTAHDLQLWEKLHSEKREQKLGMPNDEFEVAPVIYGDCNDYVERIWSEERFRAAVRAFDDAVVIHDIATRNSVVHTDYKRLHHTVLNKEKTILTHSPDTMTSAWVLSKAGKSFIIRGTNFHEIVEDKSYPFNADIYHKEAGKYYVGYRNESGAYFVCEKDRLLTLSRDERPSAGTLLYRVDLYEDIGGQYFPRIERAGAEYQCRADGKVELVEYSREGSRGAVVEGVRERFK
jgi:ribonuclease BN (tRNA processing enzyme)